MLNPLNSTCHNDPRVQRKRFHEEICKKREPGFGHRFRHRYAYEWCGSSDDFVFTNTNVQVAPVVVDDAFNALGNTTVDQPATGVLANDTANGGAISSFDAVGSNGGAITLRSSMFPMDSARSHSPL
jgi:hypothetical protein